MREVYDLIVSLSSSDASALITGESGTGKELAAGTIHRLSKRADGPFIPVNSAAIPETLIESEVFGHEKGASPAPSAFARDALNWPMVEPSSWTESGEMPLQLQPKLLRVLEDGKVRRLGGKQEFDFNVRVIAATNQEPRQAIQDGRLREDLYYRLTVFTVHLPPLRDRKEDIPLLAQHFVGEVQQETRRQCRSSSRGRSRNADGLFLAGQRPRVPQRHGTRADSVEGRMDRDLTLAAVPQKSGRRVLYEIVLSLGITAADAQRELIR